METHAHTNLVLLREVGEVDELGVRLLQARRVLGLDGLEDRLLNLLLLLQRGLVRDALVGAGDEQVERVEHLLVVEGGEITLFDRGRQVLDLGTVRVSGTEDGGGGHRAVGERGGQRGQRHAETGDRTRDFVQLEAETSRHSHHGKDHEEAEHDLLGVFKKGTQK